MKNEEKTLTWREFGEDTRFVWLFKFYVENKLVLRDPYPTT